MKLISIQLCNFRQFYGQTPQIKLASGAKNITVIYGNNGAGKTTLLNGFTWALYEKFTAAFASHNYLVNKRAINEVNVGGYVEYWVDLHFEHDNKLYQVKRKGSAYLDKNKTLQHGNSKLFMLVAGDNGRWYPPPQQPEDIIQNILPESLHQYFFFDGEHIDHIFRDGEKNKIAEDTKELIGVKVLDRAIEHLKKVKQYLGKELKDIGDPETKKLLQEQNKKEGESDRLLERQEKITQELAELEATKKELANRLLELNTVNEIQKNKQKLEAQETEIRQKLVETGKELKNHISGKGYTVFLPDLQTKFQKIINQLREKGELSSGIKQQFIHQLLQRQRCICGLELREGSEHYHQVQTWLNRAGIANVEEGIIRLETQIEEVQKQLPEFWQKVDTYQVNISQWRYELSQIETELDEIKDKLRKFPDEDIQQIQINLDGVEKEIKKITLEQGANQQKITTINQEVEEITKQITKHKMKQDKQILAQRRIKATQEAMERLIEVRSRLERQFRLSLEKRVQEIFAAISFTPYLPRIRENYELDLIENTSGRGMSVAASTGENQILSLSFIGGIMDRVRAWSQKNTLMGPDSSTFPIVMDSPFGSLDEIYRRQVAKSIPQLANQLIVLVTKTQWRGEVATEMAQYLGKEYILVYHSPKPDCQADSIELKGKTYPLVKKSVNNFESSEILPIE
ncbi:MAG: AAA family ATPase [Gomphosphaeria aponina SAG 52.96 = DSM 107014]|uniref:Nuclease SbcCD subunit C n=1 Tax=Gomphosphaeria aponina SAG 52.96 = DSM 107014 TaxID=1521640 RepID=A0A941GMW4_9CHRO|nr:AAA family ATPase [Gomphosphaeria aponina SAG 52.96 = DSM 107014]